MLCNRELIVCSGGGRSTTGRLGPSHFHNDDLPPPPLTPGAHINSQLASLTRLTGLRPYQSSRHHTAGPYPRSVRRSDMGADDKELNTKVETCSISTFWKAITTLRYLLEAWTIHYAAHDHSCNLCESFRNPRWAG